MLATAGGMAALYCSFAAFLESGKEVLTFEPTFPGYINQVNLTGGILRGIPMTKRIEDGELHWDYDFEAFTDALGPQTGIVIMINPHSPTGRVMTSEEV